MKNKTVILIPARMESSRFPGKPLAPIRGIPLVIFCAKNALATGIDTIVCTDSREIKTVCDYHKIPSLLTPKFNTGTDRIAWCARDLDYEVFINLQGDEPLIEKEHLFEFHKEIAQAESLEKTIYTGVSRVNSDLANDPNNVKCVVREDMSVIYFSRMPLKSFNSDDKPYFKQLGLYGMTKATLQEFAGTTQSSLELIEKVELQRWLQYGHPVKACQISAESISVDTPSDFVAVLDRLSSP